MHKHNVCFFEEGCRRWPDLRQWKQSNLTEKHTQKLNPTYSATGPIAEGYDIFQKTKKLNKIHSLPQLDSLVLSLFLP